MKKKAIKEMAESLPVIVEGDIPRFSRAEQLFALLPKGRTEESVAAFKGIVRELYPSHMDAMNYVKKWELETACIHARAVADQLFETHVMGKMVSKSLYTLGRFAPIKDDSDEEAVYGAMYDIAYNILTIPQDTLKSVYGIEHRGAALLVYLLFLTKTNGVAPSSLYYRIKALAIDLILDSAESAKRKKALGFDPVDIAVRNLQLAIDAAEVGAVQEFGGVEKEDEENHTVELLLVYMALNKGQYRVDRPVDVAGDIYRVSFMLGRINRQGSPNDYLPYTISCTGSELSRAFQEYVNTASDYAKDIGNASYGYFKK